MNIKNIIYFFQEYLSLFKYYYYYETMKHSYLLVYKNLYILYHNLLYIT